MISVRHLTKTFRDDIHALKDVSVDFPSGTTTVIVGGSGAGKSTLLRCLNLLETPDFGTISTDNIELTFPREKNDKEIAQLRADSTMVFQHFHLFPHLTVADNIALSPRLTRHMDAAAAREQACKLLEHVGLGGREDDYPATLSGGQQQRVAIARALALEPQYVLCDEPTSALDPQTGAEISRLLASLADEGLSLIVVTHDMDFARRSAQRIIFLEGGKVLSNTDADEFFASHDAHIRAFLAND